MNITVGSISYSGRRIELPENKDKGIELSFEKLYDFLCRDVEDPRYTNELDDLQEYLNVGRSIVQMQERMDARWRQK
jgi:hypothetical protein